MRAIIFTVSIAAGLALMAAVAPPAGTMIAQIDPVDFPEPASVLILGLGGVFLLVRLRR